eukprot:COSAG02_NODE_688_length_18473_cov_77.428105_12_plen_64_part_00
MVGFSPWACARTGCPAVRHEKEIAAAEYVIQKAVHCTSSRVPSQVLVMPISCTMLHLEWIENM